MAKSKTSKPEESLSEATVTGTASVNGESVKVEGIESAPDTTSPEVITVTHSPVVSYLQVSAELDYRSDIEDENRAVVDSVKAGQFPVELFDKLVSEVRERTKLGYEIQKVDDVTEKIIVKLSLDVAI